MKVNKIIECLNTFYKQDDDLVIAWWDKTLGNQLIGAIADDTITPITDDEWALVCHALDDLTDRANEDVCDAIQWSVECQRNKI